MNKIPSIAGVTDFSKAGAQHPILMKHAQSVPLKLWAQPHLMPEHQATDVVQFVVPNAPESLAPGSSFMTANTTAVCPLDAATVTSTNSATLVALSS